MTEKISLIPTRIKNATKGGHVAGVEDIIDDATGRNQKEINNRLELDLGTGGNVDSRIAAAVTQERQRAENIEGSFASRLDEQDNKINQLNGSEIEVVVNHEDVTDPDPNIVYREKGESSYSDWMYKNHTWTKLATYNVGVSTAPRAGDNNLITSDGVSKHGSAIDISELNKDGNELATYATLLQALSYLPQEMKRAGMTVKFIQHKNATYQVVTKAGLTAVPSGTELNTTPSVVAGIYEASQLTAFLPLPTVETPSVTYYVKITQVIDEKTVITYDSWTITVATVAVHEYVQYRHIGTTWSDDAEEWQEVQEFRSVDVPEGTTYALLQPNKLYVFGEVESLTVNFDVSSTSDTVKEYMFQFTCPEDVDTVVTFLPLDYAIRWAGDAFEPEAGMTYQVSVVNHLGIYVSWEEEG